MMGFLVSSAVHNIFLYLPVKIANLLNWTNWKSILYFWAGSLLFSPAASRLAGLEECCQTGKHWKEEYPQGTKLVFILFAVMTNRLLSDWHLCIKFVDDTCTSALEIIPRNSISLLNFAAFDIHNFAIAHNMKLNPTKCEEMFVNFLHNSNVLLNPVMRENNVIEQVKCYIRS